MSRNSRKLPHLWMMVKARKPSIQMHQDRDASTDDDPNNQNSRDYKLTQVSSTQSAF